MKKQSGFLLMEALLALLVLSVAFVVCLGAVAQALRLSSRAEETTKAVLASETLLFELETGMRPDLVVFGGRGERAPYRYVIESETTNDLEKPIVSFYDLKARMDWKEGRDYLDFEAYLPEGAFG